MVEDRDELKATPIEISEPAETEVSSTNGQSTTQAELSGHAEDQTTSEDTRIGAEESVSVGAVETLSETVEEAKTEGAAKTQPKIDEKTSREDEGGSHIDYSRTFRSLSEGDVVDGVVVHIDKEGVLVDVGTKSEGIIRPGELSVGPIQAAEDVVSVGDTIKVYVLSPEGRDGNLMLSKKRADFEKAWERVQQAYEEGKVVSAMVTDRVKGGLVVDLGIRGFVPGSHVGSGKVKNLDRYVGQSLPLKVIEVDRERRKVVLSHRLAVEEERGKQRERTIGSLIEGEIREGIVRRITDYGAFVDLGGIDGLLHVSEMSWTRISHPSDVVKVGQKIHVMVLKLNLEAGRVSLGLRQILPDPWAGIEGKYKVGQIISAAISRLVPFGAFVQLEGGIEAIIPNTELSQRRVNRPEDVVSVGDVVEARIVDLRSEERRMTLSIRQVHEDKERREYESYQSSRSDGRMTLGDLVGEKLQQLVSTEPKTEIPAEETEEETVEEPVAKASEDMPGETDSESVAEELEASTETVASGEEEPALEALLEEKSEEESS